MACPAPFLLLPYAQAPQHCSLLPVCPPPVARQPADGLWHPARPARRPCARSWQQARCVDEHGNPLAEDIYHAPLTLNSKEFDTMALGTIRLAYK